MYSIQIAFFATMLVPFSFVFLHLSCCLLLSLFSTSFALNLMAEGSEGVFGVGTGGEREGGEGEGRRGEWKGGSGGREGTRCSRAIKSAPGWPLKRVSGRQVSLIGGRVGGGG